MLLNWPPNFVDDQVDVVGADVDVVCDVAAAVVVGRLSSFE